jgi:hypothetical protein
MAPPARSALPLSGNGEPVDAKLCAARRVAELRRIRMCARSRIALGLFVVEVVLLLSLHWLGR